MDIADLKAFVTSDEDGAVSGRYNDARLTRNQLRALASNDTGEEPRGLLPSETTLASDAFFKLVHPLFGDAHKKDTLAVMERSTTFVFTDSASCVRLPSECPDAIVHRVADGNVHLDLLMDRDKHLYEQYEQGLTVYGASYAAEVEQEQAMIDECVEYMAQFPNTKHYVSDCSQKLQKWLRPVGVLPSSPDSPEQTEQAGDLRLSPCFLHSRQQVPPNPRQVSSPHAGSDCLAASTSSNPDEQDTLVPQILWDPEEEAARAMREE